MYEKIVNPLTGRKVSIYSKKGKEILNQYFNQIAGAKPINSCSLLSMSNSYGRNYKNHPFQIGDKFKIVFGLAQENIKKKRYAPTNIQQLIGSAQFHSWIEITSNKNGCKTSFGLAGGQEMGDMWTQGTNSMVLTPDFASSKCRYLAKQCLDKQEQGLDYIRGELNVNSGEEGGCRYVCKSIQTISDGDSFNNYYPEFIEIKKGKLRHVHIRIIEWILMNSNVDERGTLMTEVPFKYLLTAAVLGGAVQLFKNWIEGEASALANCQTFASDFHSNPTYIFNKLYPGVYDERVENEKTALEKRIAKLRWNKLKHKFKLAVEIQKHQNNIDEHQNEIKKQKKLLKKAKSPQAKRIRNRNIKKEQNKINNNNLRIDRIKSKIDKIKHFDQAVNPEMIERLLEEREVLNNIID